MIIADAPTILTLNAHQNTFPHEDAFSAATNKLLWNNYQQLRYCAWHVPNECKKAKGETPKDHMMRILQERAVGVLKGVFDWHCLWDGRYNIMELKQPGGHLSPEQIQYANKMLAQGATATVCYSLPDVVEWVERVVLGGAGITELGNSTS